LARSRSKAPKEPTRKLLLELEESLAERLDDFCEAHYDGVRASVIRKALEKFLEERLTDPEEAAMRKRYEEIRKKRLGGTGAT
jgi:metal-responsive CopG/Arc/MetJ family transcriptional regulator